MAGGYRRSERGRGWWGVELVWWWRETAGMVTPHTYTLRSPLPLESCGELSTGRTSLDFVSDLWLVQRFDKMRPNIRSNDFGGLGVQWKKWTIVGRLVHPPWEECREEFTLFLEWRDEHSHPFTPDIRSSRIRRGHWGHLGGIRRIK